MAMKSAYELAMERLAAQSKTPARKLTDADKAKLAELDKLFAAKIAERELALKPKIAEARAQGNLEEAAKLEEKLRVEVQQLRAELEKKKNAIREGGR